MTWRIHFLNPAEGLMKLSKLRKLLILFLILVKMWALLKESSLNLLGGL